MVKIRRDRVLVYSGKCEVQGRGSWLREETSALHNGDGGKKWSNALEVKKKIISTIRILKEN